MSQLFDTHTPSAGHDTRPLAERMRPRTLADMAGQQHLVGPGAPLRLMVESGRLPSLLFWGPPGVGKTTLAGILAASLNRPFYALSAIQSGVKEVRAVLDQAENRPGTVLFIDEIHRFNKAQQDALLHAVERGTITLIGATTENPSFEVISALLSRCQLYVLEALKPEDLHAMLMRATATDPWLLLHQVQLDETAALYNLCNGDARKALNLLELTVMQAGDTLPLHITDERVMAAARQKTVIYDKQGEMHYDVISAFIKSMRGSDPNGTIYWLARMIEGGEDAKFIARRMVILASEDIGNANPNALVLATACFTAITQIGMPEGRIVLAQTATYLATSPKSNASYLAIDEALADVRRQPATPVPLHLRNAPTEMMKNLGYHKGYKYSHDHTGADARQQYLPAGLEGRAYYQPRNSGKEAELLRYLRQYWGPHYPAYAEDKG